MSLRHYEGLAGLSKILIAMIFVLASIQSYSQCSLKCNNQVNISLDENCMATVTPEMIINSLSTTCPGGMYSVRLESTNGAIIDPPIVGLSQVDQTFSARVTDTNSGNNCWGYVTIEYKLAPAIQCPENDTVSCAAVDVLGVPTATARCGGGSFEVFLLDEQRETLECDTAFTGRVTRTYRAVDNATGNFTDCTQTLHLERIDFSNIVFPDNATIACDDPNFIFNNDGFPIPFISGEIPTGSGSAGVPIICMPTTGSGTMGTPNNIGFEFAVCGSGSAGVPILPVDGASIATDDGPVIVPSNLGSFCGAALVFTDIPVSSNPCRKTIMRTFEVIEWFCGADSSRVGAQVIEVIDTTAPVFICPQDFTVSSDEDCEMLVDFPSVNATDGCGNGIIVQIDPEGSPIVNSNGGQGMLQSGVNLVTYTVRDSCYNSATCQLSVTVQDQVEPVAICESRTTVALTSSGSTFVNAYTFDDGSWDGCGVDRFEVRRMTTDCNPDDLVFGQQVEFCCTDAETEVMVVFRVFDTSGNTNDCMVSVEVQALDNPIISCPDDVTIDCRVAYDIDSLSLTFGSAIASNSCPQSDTINERVEFDVNQCGIGRITRTFFIGTPAEDCCVGFEDLDNMVLTKGLNLGCTYNTLRPAEAQCSNALIANDQLFRPVINNILALANVGPCFGNNRENFMRNNPTNWLGFPQQFNCVGTSTATGNGSTTLLEYLFQGRDNFGLPTLIENNNYNPDNTAVTFQSCLGNRPGLSDFDNTSSCGVRDISESADAGTVEGWVLVPCGAVGISARAVENQAYRVLAISETGDPADWDFGFEGYSRNGVENGLFYTFKTQCSDTDNDNNNTCSESNGMRVMWFRAYIFDPRLRGSFRLDFDFPNGESIPITSEFVSSVDPRKIDCVVTEDIIRESCEQVITITNTAPFTESMIQWPSDFVSTSGVCTIDDVNPEDLDPQFAFPIFTGGDDQCSMLGFSYEDNLVSSNVPGQCFRIERTWYVINWCDDSGNTFAQFTDPDGPQIIEVNNTDGPMTDAFDPITIESQNIDCTSGLIEYTRTGTGSCAGTLSWSYVVNDLGGNQMAVGDTNVFSEVLVAAQYNVVWTISDECNNTVVQNQSLTVINTKAPTPVCMTNLTFALDTPTDTNGDGMNDGASLELWASDFDGGSYHTCNNPISVSLSDDPTETNITFTCDSVGSRTLRLYVTDDVTMAQDFCTFTVQITDGGMCDGVQRVVLEGDIYTEDYQSIENVEVNLINGSSMDMTNEEGHYAFNDMPMGGSYIISPEKDINYLNGVSTLDLVFIQRHILNVESLDSPYKLIAADANDSHSVTALDLIELRKLILGAHNELPNNSSWRFVDVDHNFIDEVNPWLVDMPEDYSISHLEEDMVIDFIGIKIGDVNSSVVPNLQSQILDNRSSRWPLSFTISNKEIKEGPAAVSFYSDSYERISGWQMTLEFDPTDIVISSITSDVLDINSYNYYIGAQDEGWISISYNADSPIDIDPNLEVFRVEFNSDKSLSAADVFEITSRVTPAESYRGLDEVVDVRLKVNEDNLNAIDIVSASPNPWKNQTDVSFTISEGGLCHWNIYDIRGQLVYASDHNYTAGKHELIIDRNHIPHGGVYYLKLITQNGSAEYKLMVID